MRPCSWVLRIALLASSSTGKALFLGCLQDLQIPDTAAGDVQDKATSTPIRATVRAQKNRSLLPPPHAHVRTHRECLAQRCLQLLWLHVARLRGPAEVQGDVVGHAFNGVLSRHLWGGGGGGDTAAAAAPATAGH